MDKAGIARHIANTEITEAAMKSESDNLDHHQQRSAFIRNLVQRSSAAQATRSEAQCVPRVIVQFWNNLAKLPEDVRECISTWSKWKANGFVHRVLDTEAAARFIGRSLNPDHAHAFTRCYHPAMQADYFRLCYLFVEGGMYVDADDVCVANNISSLFDGSCLKVQPLCYDIGSDSMVSPRDFLQSGASDEGWTFYFNNNPLIAYPRDPILRRALERATRLLNGAADGEFPEIQSTTGPGNLSRAVFELGAASAGNDQVQILKAWDSIAVSRWPLSYRRDTRNWRLSNGKRFHVACRTFNESI